MDRDNLGCALMEFGIGVVYLCADLAYVLCRMLAAVMRYLKR